ncbi:glycogen synthase GlgA [uncultured Desulfuromusa sp.]|uniref:glycogen synthase GlgA n=1 Tax=uncultured Desulfuromusa sp. TaxID=219183 RepID=UPI002AA75BC8|nr:glycogen synthase GlgA [uncultured Desulfuromusa sp.]
MEADFLQKYYPLGLQCGRKAWDEAQLTPQFSQAPRPQRTYFRHLLADHLRSKTTTPFTAAEMELWATLNEVLRHVANDFLNRRGFQLQKNQLSFADKTLELTDVNNLFQQFLGYFPVPEVELKHIDSADLISLLENTKQTKELFLELVLLYVQNQNPALQPARELFAAEEQRLNDVCHYRRQLEFIDREMPQTEDDFRAQPQTLLARLLDSIRQGKTLQQQLTILRRTWADILPKTLLDRISTAFKHYEQEGFQPGFPGEPETTPLNPAAFMDEEYADFTIDHDWMPRTVLLAKSTYVWLEQLSRKYQRPIHRLDQIPDEELDQLTSYGFTSLWLIGIWERSKASLKIKNLSGQLQVAASAYAINDYRIAADLGGDSALENLRRRCRNRGLDLACDVVTNHTGIESALLREHPDWFIQLPHPPYPGYRFSGVDLSEDPAYSMQIEDGYFDHSEAAVVCRYQHRQTGEVRFIYHGNDGTHLPWNDTAQLNYLMPDVREAMIRLIIDVAKRFRIIRFDAAMTLAKKHFQRLWYPLPGGGAGVPSRSDHAMSAEEFNRHFPVEFWRELVDRIRVEAPDTLLVAEAFWLMEGYFVRTLGMHRVYNSAFMNMLKKEENGKYRETLKNILAFDPAILQRFVNFMSNPDEEPAVEQFGDGDKYFCVAALLATMPGLPMFGHGQIEGFHEKYGMEYLAPRRQEQANLPLIERHEQHIFPLLRKRALFSGADMFQLYDFTSTYGIEEDVLAYSNRLAEQTVLILCNNSQKQISGKISQPVQMADKNGVSYLHACGIDVSHDFVLMTSISGGMQFLQPVEQLRSGGVFHLPPYSYRVLTDFRSLADQDGRWQTLWDRYGDTGRQNLFLDHDAILIEHSWDLAHTLLELSCSKRTEPEFSQLTEKLFSCYQIESVTSMPAEYILEILVQTIFPGSSLQKADFLILSDILTRPNAVDDQQIFQLLDKFFNHRQFRNLLSCHYYDHIDWVEQEKLAALCLIMLQFELFICSSISKSDRQTAQERILQLLKQLRRVRQLAKQVNYQVDELLQHLETGKITEKIIPVPKNKGEKILFVASEATPFAKTGGLADVVGSLPRALRQRGHDVQVVIPYYRETAQVKIPQVKSNKSIEITLQGKAFRGSLKQAVYDGVPYWFIDTPEFFDREGLYGTTAGDYPDNSLRFGFFAKAVLETAKVIEFKPDIIHIHDWQSGLIPALLKTSYAQQPFYSQTSTLLTIHNLAYQGMFSTDILKTLDLPPELGSSAALEYYGRLSILKGGINFADLINTVSPTYCHEIQEPEQGQGFDGLLRDRREDLSGIINGLDLRTWNPETDGYLAHQYSSKNLNGKELCKTALQKELGLENTEDAPIIAVVSRLDQQKGIDLIEANWRPLLNRHVQFVLLGSGSQKQMQFWKEQQGLHPGQVSINLTFDETLSHRIYAAADLLLVPSRFEPCGLTQMIALTYGALPVVRRTGGLADTVIDINENPKAGYGFVFENSEPWELLQAIDRALELYSDRKRWRTVVKRGMGLDFSWGNSAQLYENLYQTVRSKRKENVSTDVEKDLLISTEKTSQK